MDLGMESGLIPDSDITASSEKNANTAAKNGRLNYTSGSSWCAATSDSNPYLQIDLQTLHIICAVSTQGNSQADQWVKTYNLKLSTDGSTWTNYKEGGQVKVRSYYIVHCIENKASHERVPMDVDQAVAGLLSSIRGCRTSHYKFVKIQISSVSKM